MPYDETINDRHERYKRRAEVIAKETEATEKRKENYKRDNEICRIYRNGEKSIKK